MTDQPKLITRPAMWFSSKTLQESGERHCRMARYLGYHAGEHGTGWRKIRQSIPLATGSAVHLTAELMGQWIMEFQAAHRGMPPRELPKDVIAWACSEAASQYEANARARGLVSTSELDEVEAARANVAAGAAGGAEPSAADLYAMAAIGDGDASGAAGSAEETPSDRQARFLNNIILEQRTLIEAIGWVFGSVYVPNLLQTFRILDVEREEQIIIGCTCGLTEAVSNWRPHFDRSCKGIVQQGRGDWLLEGHSTANKGEIVYEEFKSKAQPNNPWEKAWEHSGQLYVNMGAAGRRLGKRVNSAYIPILFKGWRGRDRNDPITEPKYQHSILCYGYYQPARPPFAEAEWRAKFRYQDEFGKGHQLPKTYSKQPIWDESREMPAVRAGASRVESWVTSQILAAPQNWPELLKVLGPFPMPSQQRQDQHLRSIEAEEERWRADVNYIREAVEQYGVDEDEAASEVLSRSWACTHFGGDPCEFRPVCDRNPGWEQPGKMGIYKPRRPHHQPELEALESTGVTFPPEDVELGDDDVDW